MTATMLEALTWRKLELETAANEAPQRTELRGLSCPFDWCK